jgi:hypothetical protein
MDWIRENKVLAGILGVIVAGSLGLGYMLYEAWSSYTASKEQYVGLGNQIAQLKGLPLSPSEKNLADKKALVEEYASGVNKLGGALLVLQEAVLPKPTKDTEFQAKLKEKSIEIKKMASALKVQLPAEFAFGFDPYNNAPPPSEAATELSGYLEAIESIVKLAMGCKVTSIDLLERSQIPEEKGGAADTASPAKSKGKSAAKAKGTAAKASAAITEKRQVSMILTLDQGPLQLLMARLANPADMPYFASVRVLRVENQTKLGALKGQATSVEPNAGLPPATTTEPTAEGDPKKDAVASVEIKPPPVAPQDAFPIMGQELLKVQMEIDLVKFLPSARGVAAAPAGAAAPR